MSRMVVHMLADYIASSNNGISYDKFTKGEFYAVPDYIAVGMFARHVAEPAKADDVSDDEGDVPKLDLTGGKRT